ncbi:MATE family efflux transporter [Candidatus Epulonipiscium fishelsonii]|uniref:MATE family efflux transporter n=1 Tax=Candidatus Epulonipiscium fishelsonii TaxID=77094 RepID=A0ACC8XHL5_9FIRM|nr:MATE family efflux transporter [Epulopiscium sp. SCG-B05WGA-EpuloA1]ONI42889.1 MATE family efflux transporter [Epulopiscium sp. SCG-B11WGA-EpuloA1]
MNNQQILGTAPITKLLLKYSLPAIIGMMVNGLYNVVDRMFIANIPNVGHLAITGLGVTMPIMTILFAFGVLIGIGAASNISIKLGEEKPEVAQQILGNAIALAVIIGISLSVLGLIFVNQILTLFGASPDSLIYAKEYINVILLGAVFNILGYTCTALIRSDGNPKLSAIIMSAGCGLNIILDATFIFGFGLGIKGAALATIISQAMTTIWGLSYYLKGKSNVSLKKSNLKLHKNLILAIIAIGMGPFSMQVASSGVQAVCNNTLRIYGGDLAIGAMSSINSIIMMSIMPVLGMSQGAQPIVGFNYGAKQYDRSTKTLAIAMTCTIAFLSFLTIIIQSFPDVLIGLFSGNNPELTSIAVNGIKKYTITLYIVPISMLSSQYMQAIGKAKISIVLALLRQVIVLIPTLFILPKYLGLDGVWYAQPLADVITVIVSIILLSIELKKQKLAMEQMKIDTIEHTDFNETPQEV